MLKERRKPEYLVKIPEIVLKLMPQHMAAASGYSCFSMRVWYPRHVSKADRLCGILPMVRSNATGAADSLKGGDVNPFRQSQETPASQARNTKQMHTEGTTDAD